MTKYIDADKLKRFVKSIGLTPQKSADYNDGRDDVKMMVLDFIDSLQQEQPEVDLEKALNSLDDAYFDLGGIAVIGATHYLTVEDLKDIARHFYELGKNSK